ncbi:hypothetical protein HJFPF1_13038 [Paramyrothecium foliicola]|nr:hypothetical protein HJFPF1_13038 [Paramyrothecium foliicola]
MKIFNLFILAFCCAVSAVSSPSPGLEPFSNFLNNEVFRPGPDFWSWGTIYARTIQLKDGTHLITWENYPPEPPLMPFPIWKSVDGGASWSDFRNVSDQVNDWGLRYQPHFYMLEEDVGDYPAGTLLLSGMSVKKDLSEAWLDVYASNDKGGSWRFVSHIAYAPGPETVNNGDKAVWEPFFVMRGGVLICYYSDQRDPLHAQKLVHVTTTDLKHWSEPVNDVALPEYTDRPGMTTVAHIKSTDKYIMTFEICGRPGCPTWYKVASSPYTFDEAEMFLLTDRKDGQNPGSSPFIIWTPHPARDDGSGLIIMNGAKDGSLYVNEDDASPDGWTRFETGQQSAHSRTLEIIDVHGEKKLMIASGGHMNSNHDNYVSVGVVDIPTL